MPPKKVEKKLVAVDDKINPASADNPSSNKAKLLTDIKEGLKEVKKIRDGETKSYSMDDLFGGTI